MLLKKSVKYLISLVSILIRNFIPKKKDLIIMQSNSLQRYCENTRFLYEYVHEKGDLDVYWDTASRQIYNFLKSRGRKVLWHYSFKAYFAYLRAGIVVGTGSEYPDLLKAVGNKTTKYCLYHGSGPKVTVYTQEKLNKTLSHIYKNFRYDFFNTTSVFDRVMKGLLAYKIPHSKLVINGYPRCDHLFDKEKISLMYTKREISKGYFPSMDETERILLYAPTHRTYDLKNTFPLNMYQDFSMDELERFLENKRMYLLITNHGLLKDKPLINSNRIKYVDTDNSPFFDINLLYPEVDILIGDFSTVHTDFAILDRPQIHAMPDFEEYFWHKGFLEDYRSNLAGKEAKSFNHLLELIESNIANPSLDRELRMKLLEKYYDTGIKNSCERNYIFLKEKCSG